MIARSESSEGPQYTSAFTHANDSANGDASLHNRDVGDFMWDKVIADSAIRGQQELDKLLTGNNQPSPFDFANHGRLDPTIFNIIERGNQPWAGWEDPISKMKPTKLGKRPGGQLEFKCVTIESQVRG